MPGSTSPRGLGRRVASDGATLDHELLMGAVASRLRGCVDSLPAAPSPVRQVVQDCARALEQLRHGLAQDRAGMQRLERELHELRGALAAARQELAGTRDGERRARHLAEHDSLTSLPNRSCFLARLEAALAEPDDASGRGVSAVTVLFLDLDDFKPINDRHGHQTGDELLRIVAHRLRRAVRANDMVCRMGGDEFACLLTTPMTEEQLSHVAIKLFDVVSEPLNLGALELTVLPSIGIARYPGDGDSAAALLQHADNAMYRAKRSQSGYSFLGSRGES